MFAFGNNDTGMTESGVNLTVEASEANARTILILSKAMSQYPTLMIGPSPNTDPDHRDRIQALNEILGSLCMAGPALLIRV